MAPIEVMPALGLMTTQCAAPNGGVAPNGSSCLEDPDEKSDSNTELKYRSRPSSPIRPRARKAHERRALRCY